MNGTELTITDDLSISLSEIRFQFARSGGHGGQNVNKVETRVDLLYDVGKARDLSEDQRQRLLHQLKSRIDARGILRITSQDSRSQWTNRQHAIARFVKLLQQALKPVRKRVATRIPRGAKRKRKESKERRAETKQQRRKPDI